MLDQLFPQTKDTLNNFELFLCLYWNPILHDFAGLNNILTFDNGWQVDCAYLLYSGLFMLSSISKSLEELLTAQPAIHWVCNVFRLRTPSSTLFYIELGLGQWCVIRWTHCQTILKWPIGIKLYNYRLCNVYILKCLIGKSHIDRVKLLQNNKLFCILTIYIRLSCPKRVVKEWWGAFHQLTRCTAIYWMRQYRMCRFCCKKHRLWYQDTQSWAGFAEFSIFWPILYAHR